MIRKFHFPRIKVCGLSSLEDIAAVVEGGADAVGFVHATSSPRAVSSYYVNRMVGNLPDTVATVGVFVDTSPADALHWCKQGGVMAVQLCGSENAADWNGFQLPVLRRVGVDANAAAEMDAWSDVAAGFVLDHPSAPGGTGQPVDWTLAADLAQRAKCLLAGGLDASNVAEAVAAVRPAGVDASSQLENAPGMKDVGKISAFIASARAAFGDAG